MFFLFFVDTVENTEFRAGSRRFAQVRAGFAQVRAGSRRFAQVKFYFALSCVKCCCLGVIYRKIATNFFLLQNCYNNCVCCPF